MHLKESSPADSFCEHRIAAFKSKRPMVFKVTGRKVVGVGRPRQRNELTFVTEVSRLRTEIVPREKELLSGGTRAHENVMPPLVLGTTFLLSQAARASSKSRYSSGSSFWHSVEYSHFTMQGSDGAMGGAGSIPGAGSTPPIVVTSATLVSMRNSLLRSELTSHPPRHTKRIAGIRGRIVIRTSVSRLDPIPCRKLSASRSHPPYRNSAPHFASHLIIFHRGKRPGEAMSSRLCPVSSTMVRRVAHLRWGSDDW